MNEVKIEHITNARGDTFEITDTSGNHVILKPDEALLCLQFLYGRVDEIARLVNVPGRAGARDTRTS
jgi:hypothetical protein